MKIAARAFSLSAAALVVVACVAAAAKAGPSEPISPSADRAHEREEAGEGREVDEPEVSEDIAFGSDSCSGTNKIGCAVDGGPQPGRCRDFARQTPPSGATCTPNAAKGGTPPGFHRVLGCTDGRGSNETEYHINWSSRKLSPGHKPCWGDHTHMLCSFTARGKQYTNCLATRCDGSLRYATPQQCRDEEIRDDARVGASNSNGSGTTIDDSQ